MVCGQIAYRLRMDPYEVLRWPIKAIIAYQRIVAKVAAEDQV